MSLKRALPGWCLMITVALGQVVAEGPCAAAELRTWTDAEGSGQVEAELVGFFAGWVRLKQPDGTLINLPVTHLSKADREFVRQNAPRRQIRVETADRDEPGSVRYGEGRARAVLANRTIDESSGLARSPDYAGLFWTHNDSGDAARLFLIDGEGRDHGSFVLRDVRAYDWEDMASFVYKGQSYLLVADVGNNGRAAAVHMIYVIEEPSLDENRRVATDEIEPHKVIYFSYADDHRNCEAVAVDPRDRTIFLIVKESDPDCQVYALPWPKADTGDRAAVARPVARVKLPSVTGMDISPDGRRAAVSTYESVYQYVRRAEESWAKAFSRLPREVAVPERIQGESVCYGSDGRTLYLTSEQLPTPLFEIPVAGQ
jgi:hypothetical protein